jgi:Tfp pilus assembly PilM family ATPase
LKKRAIGLELTDHAMILCEVARENGFVQVKRQEMISLPSDVIVMGEIKDSITLSRTISSIVPNPFFAPIPIIVSMSGLQAFIRKFSIPFVPDQEIAKVVRWEGENILPYPIVEVCYHYQVIGRTDDQYQVLFAAHRRERVEPYVRLFHDLDLSVRLLTIHPFGLTNYLESTGQLHDFSGILARFRSSEFELVVFFEGVLELVRTVVMGERNNEQEMADCFYEELTSTLEHFQAERGVWLNSGIFFGSAQTMQTIREEMPSFHWRHFYPKSCFTEGTLWNERAGLRESSDQEKQSGETGRGFSNLHQELPCAFGLAMLGVGR